MNVENHLQLFASIAGAVAAYRGEIAPVYGVAPKNLLKKPANGDSIGQLLIGPRPSSVLTIPGWIELEKICSSANLRASSFAKRTLASFDFWVACD